MVCHPHVPAGGGIALRQLNRISVSGRRAYHPEDWMTGSRQRDTLRLTVQDTLQIWSQGGVNVVIFRNQRN